MVARYTTGLKYEQHAELVQRIISAADGLVVEALRLADADEHAFQGVIDAYKLPSGTEDLKAARTVSIQDALILAAQTPHSSSGSPASFWILPRNFSRSRTPM